MDTFNGTPVMFPVEPGEFIELIRRVVKEELQKFAAGQGSGEFKVAGLTYKPLYKMDEVCRIPTGS